MVGSGLTNQALQQRCTFWYKNHNSVPPPPEKKIFPYHDTPKIIFLRTNFAHISPSFALYPITYHFALFFLYFPFLFIFFLFSKFFHQVTSSIFLRTSISKIPVLPPVQWLGLVSDAIFCRQLDGWNIHSNGFAVTNLLQVQPRLWQGLTSPVRG
jgi:hypothetical protein